MKTGEKSCVADIRFNQKVTDKRSEQFQRKFNVNVERQCLPAIGRSSDSFSCSNNPSYIIYDAIDIDLSYQKRVDEKPMSLNMKVNIPQQNPISIKYDEIIRSKKSFNGILKYSFNANDSAAEKTYTCDVNQPYVDSYSMNCQRERTNLTIDIDPKTGNKKFIVDLNRFTGERFGYETAFNFSTREIETTYYTLVTSRMMKHRFGTLSVITAKQKDQEVQCITTSTADFAGYKIRFLSANIKLNFKEKSICVPIDISRFDADSKSNTISLSETYPQQRDSSQVLGKIGSHNGLFGLETVKKSYKLQIGDASLTVYDVQHWKTYLENIQVEFIHERIVNFVRKLLVSFEKVAKRNSEQRKAIFKAIDDASKGDDNEWFRVLVADIDSNAVAAATDDELTKVFKKLGNSSNLLISNMQQISQRINQRRECIRHLQKASMNNTNSEILYSIDRRPGTNSETNKLVLLMNRFQTRGKTFQHCSKTVRTFDKRLFKRNPSLTPEFNAVIANTGHTIDLFGDCVLAHDFGGL
ncbi:unnamed protein product [Rotaria magnacalcarata]|uniref:Uncharacterized protein n=1 Tax=Rotaria magnacalcarata TaxID=392030 RepID=A0A816RF56_9BILA|nr:unnamed protein product [Rotaria magnacalcarata]